MEQKQKNISFDIEKEADKRDQIENIENSIEEMPDWTKNHPYIDKNHIYHNLTMKTLLCATILGIMGGFISTLIPFENLMKIIYPFVGGTALLSGHHLLWMALSYGISNHKAYSVLITCFMKGIIEMLLSDFGALILPLNLLEGVFLLIGFFIVSRFNEKNTNLGWAIAGGIGNLLQIPIFWGLNGRFATIHWSITFIAFIFAFLSGVLITGILGKQITKLINSSLKNNIKSVNSNNALTEHGKLESKNMEKRGEKGGFQTNGFNC